MPIFGNTGFDLGVGNGVLTYGPGSLKYTNVASKALTQVKTTGVGSPGGVAGTGPAWLGAIINGDNTVPLSVVCYDANTAGGCVASAVVYQGTIPVNTVQPIGIPCTLGLWVTQTQAAATAPMTIVYA
jgi:hypothetical protein